MSKVSLADELEEWYSIAAGMADTEGLDKPDLRDLHEQLAAMIDAVRQLAAEQADLKGRRQTITQQLRITRRHGQDLLIRIKSAIRAALGHNNELLVRFNIRPIRSRKTREGTGLTLFPRPDLAAAVGLPQKPPLGAPETEN
jgi:hypothetical protein